VYDRIAGGREESAPSDVTATRVPSRSDIPAGPQGASVERSPPVTAPSETYFRRDVPRANQNGTKAKPRLAEIDFRSLAQQYAQEAPDSEPGAFIQAVSRSLGRYRERSPKNAPPPTGEELDELFTLDLEGR
jgi:hypothetical protein